MLITAQFVPMIYTPLSIDKTPQIKNKLELSTIQTALLLLLLTIIIICINER